MCHIMKKPRELKLRRFSSRLVDINEELAACTGAKASDKIGETELQKSF